MRRIPEALSKNVFSLNCFFFRAQSTIDCNSENKSARNSGDLPPSHETHYGNHFSHDFRPLPHAFYTDIRTDGPLKYALITSLVISDQRRAIDITMDKMTFTLLIEKVYKKIIFHNQHYTTNCYEN